MAFPTKDSLLVPYSTNFDAVLTANFATYGFTLEQAQAYTAVHTPYVAAVEALNEARASGVISKPQREARDTARQNLLDIGRPLYASVYESKTISNEDKTLLGVHVRAGSYTPHPVLKVAPAVLVDAVSVRTVTVKIFDSASRTKRGKAPGATGAYVYTYVGEDYPADPAAWTFQGTATKTTYDITFPSALAGGTQVWIMAAWLNTKAQAGPPSVPVSTYLQGGGVVVPQGEMRMAA